MKRVVKQPYFLSTFVLINVCVCVCTQLLFGCAAQYILMPLLGVFISKALGLSSTLSAGLILLSCCPGGTASNVVRIYYNLFSDLLFVIHARVF